MNDSQKDNLIRRFDTIANKLDLFSDEEVLRLAKQHAKLQHRRRTAQQIIVAVPICLLLALGGVWLIHRQPDQNPNLIAHNSLIKQTTPNTIPTQSVAETEPLIQLPAPAKANTVAKPHTTKPECHPQPKTDPPQCGIIECKDWCENQEILAELNYFLETSYKV